MEQSKREGEPLPGTSYRLVRRIGAGSSSEVYEALGCRGEARALKILRQERVRNREAAARLIQEARALAVLEHPHVVRIEDAGVTADGRPFLVMPLLLGQTLRKRLDARGPLPPSAAVGVARQVLSALAAAHRAGIVHRDVKPANVFLARDPARPGALGRTRRERWASASPGDLGRALLLDFGIAKVRWTGAELTSGEHVIGTPRYLAPEQILGGQIDARTDVYALGLILFEAIAGRSPFAPSDPIKLMRAHISEPPLRLGDLAGVPPALDRAVARAIAKAPAMRWQTADAMSEALASACADLIPEAGAARVAARAASR